jgi:mannosyl-3-phosphoglycerate phosphatase
MTSVGDRLRGPDGVRVADLTGLPLREAGLARGGNSTSLSCSTTPGAARPGFLQAIEAKGLHWTRGRFHHILGDNDKGRAVRLLAELYRRGLPGLVTVGIGDALNDLPLFQAVDVPVLVQREDGSYAEGVRSPRLAFADAPGPTGWNKAILRIFAG